MTSKKINCTLPDRHRSLQFLWTGFLLSIIFVTIYGTTNYLAGIKDTHFRFWFDWEKNLPLVPWMIVPYLSLNLLTLCPLFYTQTAVLRHLGRAMIAATFVAGLIFWLFPAPVAFARSVPAGMWAAPYSLVHSVDNIYNTLPSLHVTFSMLTVISLWASCSRHEKIFFSCWLSLISLSVLLTWQHHVLDVMAGFLLAAITWKFTKLETDQDEFFRPLPSFLAKARAQ